jgi:hypothetical protein
MDHEGRAGCDLGCELSEAERIDEPSAERSDLVQASLLCHCLIRDLASPVRLDPGKGETSPTRHTLGQTVLQKHERGGTAPAVVESQRDVDGLTRAGSLWGHTSRDLEFVTPQTNDGDRSGDEDDQPEPDLLQRLGSEEQSGTEEPCTGPPDEPPSNVRHRCSEAP